MSKTFVHEIFDGVKRNFKWGVMIPLTVIFALHVLIYAIAITEIYYDDYLILRGV